MLLVWENGARFLDTSNVGTFPPAVIIISVCPSYVASVSSCGSRLREFGVRYQSSTGEHRFFPSPHCPGGVVIEDYQFLTRSFASEGVRQIQRFKVEVGEPAPNILAIVECN